MSRFCIRIVSLSNHQGRRSLIARDMKRCGFEDDFDFFAAHRVDALGQLGCAKSHLAVIGEFITQFDQSFDYLLVLEDDAEISFCRDKLLSLLERVDESLADWDVIQLGLNEPILADPVNIDGSYPYSLVLRSYGTFGYLIHKNSAAKVFELFKTSVDLLSQNFELIQTLKRMATNGSENERSWGGYSLRRLFEVAAIDNIWATLQLSHRVRHYPVLKVSHREMGSSIQEL